MKEEKIKVAGGLRTGPEAVEASLNKEWFDKNTGDWEHKMENFPKYVRRQNLTRFLVLYEIFNNILNVKGSIVECGVNQGYGVMTWAKLSAILEPVNLTRRIYGFDTFEGLPEDWHDKKAGTYSSDATIPQIEGGEFIAGKFEDTLPVFFSEPRPKASIINFDADLYSSTICALNFSKPVIDKHTILIFDEFIINKNWEQDEYKALEEFCANNNSTYEVLAVSFFTKQVAVKINGI